MSAWFVAGTGTGIGKTFTTCALLHAKPGARGYKPIVSGFDADNPEDDCVQIAKQTGVSPEAISLWRLKAPLSPDIAAAQEGKSLALGELVDWTEAQLEKSGNALFETVGGVMVPINTTHTTRDWMAACKLPVIVVAGSYLGAISHTLTTLEALRAAAIPMAALVINESCDSTVELTATADSIAPHASDIPLILTQPRVSSPAQATVIHSLWEHLA